MGTTASRYPGNRTGGGATTAPPPGLPGQPVDQDNMRLFNRSRNTGSNHRRNQSAPTELQNGSGGRGPGGPGRGRGGGGGRGGSGGPGRGEGVQAHGGPGAFSVGTGQAGAPGTVFRVTIPSGVRPGEEFQVYAGSRIVRVRCPMNCRANQSLQITVPPDPTVNQTPGMAALSPASGGAPVDTPPALRRQQQQQQQQPPEEELNGPGVRRIDTPGPDGQYAYQVPIPAGVRGGQQFPVLINGQQLMVTCPTNAREGMSVRIVPPAPPPGARGVDVNRPPDRQIRQRPKQQPQTQMFEVVVPMNARPGQPFALMAGGQRVLVTCPPNATPGQRIRFQLPIALTQPRKKKGGAPDVKLAYDKDGWARTIRVTDMKFQWIRMDDNGDVDLNKRFDMKTSAYVRKIDYYEGSDPRMRGGTLALVPASEAVVESRIRGADGSDLVAYSDIADAQVKNFDDKAQWFQDTCAQLCLDWNEGHMRINVRREFLLSDSMEAVMSLSRKDLRKVWRFEFIGEAGIDAGGLAREWFQLVTEEIFNPDNGLWQSSATNQMCMQINPSSELACPEDHLIYFRFLGRVMGKGLFDRQLVAGHMVRHLYKHMLGWPITFDDLELVDEEYYNNLKKVAHYNDEELEMMCLDFTCTESVMGAVEEIELVEGGADIPVTTKNLPEYMECCLKYRMVGRVKPQLTELLLGFFDVIPEPLLTVFDFQELELLMCGLPNIDMDDWKDNTLYTGEFDRTYGNHECCHWFWEVVEEKFDQEIRARLLQFVTGTSGVPSRGFSVLQGNDGNVRKFTIHGVQLDQCLYPRAHTCFNRIDLPLYTSKEQLYEKLNLVVLMESTGFDIE